MGLIPAALLFALAHWQMRQSNGGWDLHGFAALGLVVLTLAAFLAAPYLHWRMDEWARRVGERLGWRERRP